MTARFEVHVHVKGTQHLPSNLEGTSVDLGESVVAYAKAEKQLQAKSASTFSATEFFAGLSTHSIGQVLLYATEITSTQTLVYQEFAKYADGTLCVADVQTSGKGRGKNTWTSPPGCLMFSLYKQLSIAGDKLPFVQYVVSLAIVQAIQQAASKYIGEEHALDVRIKWPNDIYAKGLKIGGILCQSVYRDGVFHLVVGAGLNVTNSEPTTCLAALVQEQGGRTAIGHVSREEVLAAICNQLESLLSMLAAHGFGPLRAAYLSAWLHSDQEVMLEEEKSGKIERIALRIMGISDSGYMTAVDGTGAVFELHPDGNSLDFFKGLVRHKATRP